MKYKEFSVPSPDPRQLFMEWYHSTSPGHSLRDSEASYLLNSLQLTYCQRILQVGRLGMEGAYIAEEFRRNFALLVETPCAEAVKLNVARASLEDWPIPCDSMDVLILPHLLEFAADPHRVLSEAERVLKPEGTLFVLGFNPWSLPGLLRHRRSPSAWNKRFIGCFQVAEWLSLLKFEAEFDAGFGFPAAPAPLSARAAWRKSIDYLADAYAVKAVKRTWTPIPVRQAWLNARELVPGQAIAPPLMRKNGNWTR